MIKLAANSECGACQYGPNSYYCQYCDRLKLETTITRQTDYDLKALLLAEVEGSRW